MAYPVPATCAFSASEGHLAEAAENAKVAGAGKTMDRFLMRVWENTY